MKITPVIIAGGSGTRLWPLSRSAYPKQFLKLNSSKTMLQETICRIGESHVGEAITVCNEEHRFIVAEQLKELGALGKIVLEPEGKNTAPAVALAAFLANPSDLLLISPADHLIGDAISFMESVQAAIPLALDGKLVTFGINPSKANTDYGYIKKGLPLNEGFDVEKFVEKPALREAKKFLSSGEYFWNSGTFVFKAITYLNELKRYRSDIYEICKKASEEGSTDLDFFRPSKATFLKCPSESVDYAVMEKTSQACVVPLDAGWSDIGSWTSLWDSGPREINENTIVGDVQHRKVSNSYMRSENKLLVALGVENLVVVDTPDATLVASHDCLSELKDVVHSLKTEGRGEVDVHKEVYRPWGKYVSVDIGRRHQVKRITVNPGEKISVQMHHHRAEHWVVVSGTAKVTRDKETMLLTEDESVYIPLGAVHCLENPGKVKLELIEVQSGGYLGEDDIVRLQDEYGRE